MKIHGQTLGTPNVEDIFLPRGDSGIILKVQSVLDFDDFEKQYPPPTPPTVMRKGETVGTPDLDDKNYIEATRAHSQKRIQWMFLKSLEATPGLTWERIKMNDPETWGLLDEEFKAAGIAKFEVAKITSAIIRVNGLDDEYIEKAKSRFFASLAQEKKPE